MALFSFVSSNVGATVFYAFLVGISLFVAGIVWLIYISAFINKEYSNDGKKLANRVSIATIMCLIGIIMFTITGLIIASG